MSTGCDLAHQTGKALGDPSQNEECGAHIESGEQLQKAAGVGHHAARIAVPARAIDHIGKSFGVEIVFHVY